MPAPELPAGDRLEAGDGTSLTLLQRLRSDDQAAWVRLVHLYGPVVRFWTVRRGIDAADADDVVQEVFRVVVGRLAGFRRDRPGDTFRGWLHGISRNVMLRHAEQVGRQPRAAGGTEARQHMDAVPDVVAEPSDDVDPPGELSALYRRGLELVRSEFEDRTWQMFWSHVVDGRTPADVAADMGVSPAAVRQAKSRVLRRLREELGEILD